MPRTNPRSQDTQKSKLALQLAIVGAIGLLFLIGVLYLQKVGSNSGPGATSWNGEYFKFDHYARPVAVDVNGDGTEDLVGPFAVQQGEALVMRLGVFDGQTWHLLWSAGPFGPEDKAMRKSRVAVAGKRLVFVDFTSKVTIYELATGNQVASFALEREAMGLCSPSASGEKVWIWTPDLEPTHGVLVDAAAGTAAPHPPLDGCKGVLRTSDSEENTTIAGERFAETPSKVPVIPGANPQRALQSGPDAIALGSAFGTEDPIAAGYDPESGTVRWRASLGELAAQGKAAVSFSLKGQPYPADLVNGRLYWHYHLDRAHFAALDAKTGHKLWDTELPEGSTTLSQYTITTARIYLVDNRGVGRVVHILDAVTGRLIASVGSPRAPIKYDPD